MATNAKPVYKRILLKLSGEALQGTEGFGIDASILDRMAQEIKELVELGIQVGVVIGGGNLFRGAGLAKAGMNRVVGDHITVTVNGEVILDGNIREACKGHNVAPDGSDYNPYTVDHKNHPGLFNKDGYISFCGHGPGIKFRNVRVLDLSNSKKKRR